VRAIHNKSMQDFGEMQMDLLKKLDEGSIQRYDAQMKVEEFWQGALRRAVKDGDLDTGSLMAGQSVGLMDKIQPMKEIFSDLLTNAEKELSSVKERLCGL